MRNVESEDMLTVTPRQLEGLVRLATARARLLLKNQVDKDDAERAVFLMESMLHETGIDVNTGKVDLGVLQGRPRSEVSKLSTFMETIRSLEGENKEPVLEQDLVDELIKSDKFKDEDEVRRFVRKMNQEASIYESKPGHWNTV